MNDNFSLDTARLENVKQQDDGSIIAACPACRAAGSDKSGNHLQIQPGGKYGCAAYPKDGEHRKEIYKLASVHPSSRATNGSGKQFVCAYDYADADAKLSFQVVRYQNPKTFKQRRPDGNGGFIWKMNGVELVLYRLPEIIRAVRNGNPIFICEGKKIAMP